jgi:methylsterol monooxygenase
MRAAMRQRVPEKEQMSLDSAPASASPTRCPMTSSTVEKLWTMAKAFCYVFVTTIALVICLSNSLTAVAKAFWSDVGNNWAVVWLYLEKHFSSVTLFIAGSVVLHLIVFWGYSLALAYLDLQPGPTFISKYKIQPGKNEPLDMDRFREGVRVVLFNQLCVAFPIQVMCYPLFVWRGMSTTLPLPSFWYFVAEIVAFVLVEELFFYYTHRLFHTKAFYGRFHKKHHEWTAPIGIACIYAHPLEHILSNMLPVMLGPFLLGSHLATSWVWQTIAVITTINTHSGYHLPFMPSPEAHDYHHLKFNQMYGVLGLLDYFHGTDRQFRASEQFSYHRTFFSIDFPYYAHALRAQLANTQQLFLSKLKPESSACYPATKAPVLLAVDAESDTVSKEPIADVGLLSDGIARVSSPAVFFPIIDPNESQDYKGDEF